MTPRLRIELTKRRDGATILRMTRADGSATWQRHEGQTAAFFPLHDLTHYAVETVLRHRQGFYGLVADGWELGDFGAPWPRGRIPATAEPSELIVGFLDLERATGHRGSAADYNEQLRLQGVSGTLNEDDLQRIRTTISELHAQWLALDAGSTMTLHFA